MRKFERYLTATVAVVGFMLLFAFTRIPTEALKAFSLVEKTFKQAILKEKPSNFGGYDVITSASIRIEDSKKES